MTTKDVLEYGHDVWLENRCGNVLIGSYHDVRPDSCVPEDCLFSSDNDGDNDDDGAHENLFSEHEQKGRWLSWRVRTFFPACGQNLGELVWVPGMDEDDEGWVLYL